MSETPVDTNPEEVTPTQPAVSYTYSGGNMGGEQVFTCDICGTFVPRNKISTHTESVHR